MNYPLISEYIESIKLAEDNFASLTNLRPVLNEDGEPVMSSGNFAVVFKMIDIETEQYYAVKCFTREQAGRKEAYNAISKFLSYYESNYLIKSKYIDFELFVDSKNTDETEFPILLMDWVEGVTLDKYIKSYSGNPFELHDLSVSFGKMCKWLIEAPIAHGDLKPDNILIQSDGSIVLIDYDGMYVPSMEGQSARETGSLNYRHPMRSQSVFNKHIDDLALAAMALSLKAISISYGILDEYDCDDCFLFSQKDYLSLADSDVFQYLQSMSYTDASLAPYISTFILAINQIELTTNNFDFRELSSSALLAEQKFFRRKNEPMDENGVIYSFDGTQVLSFDYEASDAVDIEIKEGVICICEGAFSSYKSRKININLPKSLRFFTKDSFNYVYNRLSWKSPWFTYKDGFIYTKDYSACILQHENDSEIDDRVRIIERHCFSYMDVRDLRFPPRLVRIKEAAFSDSTTRESIEIPNSVSVIGDNAFSSCKGLKRLVLGKNLTSIGEWCFSFCKDLETVLFHDSCELKVISKKAFHYCDRLNSIQLPSSLRAIEEEAFQWCVSIEDIQLPESLTSIGESAFKMDRPYSQEITRECKLQKIVIPNKVEKIGASAFYKYTSLKEVVVLSEKAEFANGVFANCEGLVSFEAKSLKRLSQGMFQECTHLTYVNCPNLESIDQFAFHSCWGLVFKMPDTLKEIGFGAFNGVEHITTNDYFVYDNGFLFDKDKKTLITCIKHDDRIIIPEGTVSTSIDAFSHTPEYLSLPNTLTDQSIMELLGLTATYVQLPKNRNIDKSLKKIDKDKEEYYYDYDISALMCGYEPAFLDESGVLYSEDKKRLLRYRMLLQISKYTILPECEHIGEHAFEGYVDSDPEFGDYYGGNELEELVLPQNLRSIGVNALEGCRKLKRLILPEGLVKLEDRALEGCHSLKEITLPTSLRFVGDNALPKNMESVNSNSDAFKVCGDCLLSDRNDIIWISPKIKRFDLPAQVRYKGKECVTYPDCIVSRQGELLLTVPEIDHFTFPNGVKIIARNSFCHNKKIKELRIPTGVVSIERWAFSCNQSLKAIYLPRTIEQIGDLRTYQGWGRKYIEFFYPKEIHIPKGMKRHFIVLMPDVPESALIDDNGE